MINKLRININVLTHMYTPYKLKLIYHEILINMPLGRAFFMNKRMQLYFRNRHIGAVNVHSLCMYVARYIIHYVNMSNTIGRKIFREFTY